MIEKTIDLADGTYATAVVNVDSTGAVVASSSPSTVTVTQTFIRPSDTTAYAALDVVGNTGSAAVLSFAGMSRANAGAGYITKARIETNQSTCVARFRLHIFNTTPTPIADNSPVTRLWADVSKRIGYIDLDACATEGTGSDTASSQSVLPNIEFNCATASTTLYVVVETLDIFTPTSAQNFFVALSAEQN